MFKADASDATPPPSRQSPAAAAPAAATATVWHHDRSIAASATAVVDEHRGAPQRPPPLQSHCSRCTAVRSVAATIAARHRCQLPVTSPGRLFRAAAATTPTAAAPCVRDRARARAAPLAHLGDADDHVFDVRARRLDGGTRLARGEPALNVDNVLTFLVLGHRDVERQVRQVLFDLAARALDYDHACLHGDLDPVGDRHIGLLQYGLLRVREYGAAQQTISERKPRTRRGGGSGARETQVAAQREAPNRRRQEAAPRESEHERLPTRRCEA